jgi:hypothetical protein
MAMNYARIPRITGIAQIASALPLIDASPAVTATSLSRAGTAYSCRRDSNSHVCGA